jgi:two-component system response regulator PilR (NtrC family)
MKSKILIVDDEKTIRESIELVLKEEGYEIEMAANGKEALKIAEQKNFDVIITDLKMPEMDGLQLLTHCRKICPKTFFIIITAHGSLESAIEALRMGAFDYILKPFDFDDILIKLKRLFKYKELELQNKALKASIEKEYRFTNIIGKSENMQYVFKLIKKVANTKGNVLVTGKSGTGKELVARAIHHNSSRANGPFVAINCGAVVDTLMESEFFGHKKGSFTGAVKDKDGHFKLADGGTLFLDEVGDIPLHLQVKLLRAIEQSEIQPVGASAPVSIDIRIIAATNRDLLKDVENGRFRDDLYYRLNVVEIKLPSLNERREDIPLLIEHFIKKYNETLNRKIKSADNDTVRTLMSYQWKGGIRELENVIERAIILCDDEYITLEDLPANISGVEIDDPQSDKLKSAVAEFEKKHIKRILKRTEYNKDETAKILEIGLSSLYRKMDELKINLS